MVSAVLNLDAAYENLKAGIKVRVDDGQSCYESKSKPI
jgi:hypothetical protein